jgi:hypothetical protein
MTKAAGVEVDYKGVCKEMEIPEIPKPKEIQPQMPRM